MTPTLTERDGELQRVERWHKTYNAALSMPGLGRGKESLHEYLDLLHAAAGHLADLAHGPLEANDTMELETQASTRNVRTR